MFTNRREAGKQLLHELQRLDPDKTVIVALPRGGLPVADPIATALGAPLDVVAVRKIGVPGRREIALGAMTVGENVQIIINEDAARMSGHNATSIAELAERELPELRRRENTYRRGLRPVPLAGKVVVVVDDGVATGATMFAALRLLRSAKPERIVVAIPVGPPDTLEKLKEACDQVICIEPSAIFRAVGQFYRDFEQVDDITVREIIDRHRSRRAT